jgi:hypothetical protein
MVRAIDRTKRWAAETGGYLVLVEAFGIIAGSGWASGINLYLVTLLLGIAGRIGWSDIPEVLTRTDVMIVAGVLFGIEFFADKIPYLDSVWDAIHTVVRPLGAAGLGAVIAGDSGSIGAALGAVVAGALALDAHTAKATTRVVANTSPEPVSNVFSLSIRRRWGDPANRPGDHIPADHSDRGCNPRGGSDHRYGCPVEGRNEGMEKGRPVVGRRPTCSLVR